MPANSRPHVIKDRNAEIVVAVLLILFGCYLLWDSHENRGHDMPWFARWFAFW